MRSGRGTISIDLGGTAYEADLAAGLDITIPVRLSGAGVRAFHIPAPAGIPIEGGTFVGDVRRSGSCNCEEIRFTPHGNGTHTECLGHLTAERITILTEWTPQILPAALITVDPTVLGSDLVVTAAALSFALPATPVPAVVIRTAPNTPAKLGKDYSGTNPPYLAPDAAALLAERGIEHLLVDLPSLDREDDGGRLLAHRAFWEWPANPRYGCTVTELIYVPDEVPDGLYLLDLQVAPLESDAAPSRPILYPLRECR